jgi:Tol biopolymer transport system component
VADAILDGTPINWAAVESRAANADRELLERLRVLAGLADVHREPDHAWPTPNDNPTAPASIALSPCKAPGELGQWGHLKLLEWIGAGAFGQVYRARDTRLDRDVALKLLPADWASGGTRASSIIQEGRLLARVHHPNVVTIHGAERIGDRVGLWMEFVKGRTLEQILGEGKRFTVKETVEIGIQLCHAVSAVHDAGLLHRDIKAQNVMRADGGRVVLMDFGTGWEAKTDSRGALAGTPLYLASELLKGRPASVRSDVYSLGVLLYHLLTSEYPVRATELQELRRAHDRAERIDLRSACPDVPLEIAAIIERAIDPVAERRYQSGAAMAEHLRASQKRVPKRAWAALASLSLVVTALVGVTAFRRDDKSSRPASGAQAAAVITPVTSLPDAKFHPALSPDGTRVAFVWDHGPDGNIYVKSVAGDETVQVTRTVGGENYPAWSPDGRFLAFWRNFYDQAGNPTAALLIVAASGGPERRLLQVPPRTLGYGLSWSPDGRQIAFSIRPSASEPPRVALLEVATLERRWLTTAAPALAADHRPVFSNDGASIAFVRNTASESALYVLQLASGSLLQLPVAGHDIRSMAWAADDESVIFTSRRGGGRDRLWRVAISGGEPTLIAGIGEGASYPSIARQRERLVYLQTFLDQNISRADLLVEGGPFVRQLAVSNRVETGPDISPDGSKIAFTSDRAGSREIWLAHVDGQNARQLTDLRMACLHPRWSPDGNRIVFSAAASSTDRTVYVADASTGQTHRVTHGGSNDQWPTWSADGQSIYFSSDRDGPSQIWKISADGGEAVQLTRNRGFKAWESRDGRFLYYSNNAPAIWRMPTSGGQPTLVLSLAKETPFGGEWVLADDGIYWLNLAASPDAAIEFFAFDTERSTPVLVPPAYDHGSGFSVSKDRRCLLFSQRAYDGSDIMMMEGFR